MNEEQAKTKWCPFARHVIVMLEDGRVTENVALTAANRWKAPDGKSHIKQEEPRCTASACMAWRWDGKWNEDGTFLKRTGPSSYSGKSGETQGEGYCGLAGTPR